MHPQVGDILHMLCDWNLKIASPSARLVFELLRIITQKVGKFYRVTT